MKNTILMTISIFFISLSFAQERQEMEFESAKFKCDNIIKIESEKGVTEFNGNVEFKTDLVEFINANRIVYNSKTKEVLVYGTPVKIVFHGSSAEVVKNSKRDTIKYKIGEKVVYIY